MFRTLFQPHVSAAALALRLGVAAIVIVHGAIKLAQSGGSSWHGVLDEQTQMIVAWAELGGGIALVLGFLTRLAAAGIIIIQGCAIAMVTGAEFIPSELTKQGFNFQRPGYEYNFALIVMCLAIILLGSGAFSINHLIWPQKPGPQPQG
jgi:putative oxidoreductase